MGERSRWTRVQTFHSNTSFSVYQLGLFSQVCHNLPDSSLTYLVERKALLELEEIWKHSRIPEGVGTKIPPFLSYTSPSYKAHH